MKEKVTTHWKIVEDPHAPEEHWLPACWALSEQGASKNHTSSSRTVPGSFFQALTASSLLAACMAFFAMFSCDWGREVLEEFIGDQSFAAERFFAFLNIVYVLFPITLGLIFGCFKCAKKGSRSWGLGLLAVAAAPLTASIPWGFDSPIVPFLAAWAAAGLLGCWAAFVAAGSLFAALERRLTPRKVLLPALLYLIPSGLLVLKNWDGNFGFKEEVIVFNSLVFGAALLSAYRSRMKTNSSGLAAAFVVTMPVVIWNCINLGVAVFARGLTASLISPDLTPQALISALVIAGSTTLASAAGGITGAGLYRRKRSDALSAETPASPLLSGN